MGAAWLHAGRYSAAAAELRAAIFLNPGVWQDHYDLALAEQGARVVIHQQVLPKYGAYRGKGEALWKSLYEEGLIYRGDYIINWCCRCLSGRAGKSDAPSTRCPESITSRSIG